MLQVLGGALVAACFWSMVTTIALLATKGE
jgi:hypothetical protein